MVRFFFNFFIVDLRINETLQIGAVKNSAYQIWGQSVFLFFEFTIIPLKELPAPARQICAEVLDIAPISECDIAGAAIGTAEGEVGAVFPGKFDLYQHLTLWRNFSDCALAMARHIEIALNIAAHPIKPEIGELNQ